MVVDLSKVLKTRAGVLRFPKEAAERIEQMDNEVYMNYFDDFIGASVAFPTAANLATPWVVADTSAVGSPVYTRAGSNATLTLASNNEVENVCLFHGDSLAFDIDLLESIEMRVRLGAATITTGTELVFGLGSARADVTDNVVANAWFKMVGAASTTLVYCESDDGTTDRDDISSLTTLGTTFRKFVIDFKRGKSDVRFFIDDVQVATNTVFNMNAYSVGLQPIFQIQKAANVNVDSVIIDYVDITCRR